MNSISTARSRGTRGPLVVNALLRCRRDDDKAAEMFERIKEVPGLWVLELGPFEEVSWGGWITEVEQTLALHESVLRDLKGGSTDYILHVTVEFAPGFRAVTIPPSLSQLLASCGITVELHRQDA